MANKHYDSSTSGYLQDSFEGIMSHFTDVEVLYSSSTNIVAKARRYGRWWLLKALQPEMRDRKQYQLSQRKEFEILIELQNPGVVTAVGLEEIDGLGLCIVMEYVDSMTLKDWLETNPDYASRRSVFHKILDAVTYIHSKGIVHRDLKPSNILVSRNGINIKLIDFGLADTDSHSFLKQPAGTQGYMSPEQQSLAEADVRNDIYSLGVIMQKCGLKYSRIIKKCLSDAEHRYQTVDELKKAVNKRDNLKKQWYFPLIVLAIAVYTVVLMVFFKNGDKTEINHRATSTPDTVFVNVPAKIDTVYIENPSEKASSDFITPAPLPMVPTKPEINIENTKNNVAEEEKVRSAKIDRYIADGLKQMEKAWLDWPYKKHCDTLTHTRYLKEKYYWLNNFSDFVTIYVERNCKDLSLKEQSIVSDALRIRQNQLFDSLAQLNYKIPY